MKLYVYHNDNGEIKQAVVEVEEKTYLVPKGEDGLGYLPFCCEKQIENKKIGVVTGYLNDTIFFLDPAFDEAKAEFMKHAELRVKREEEAYEKEKAAYEKLVNQQEGERCCTAR